MDSLACKLDEHGIRRHVRKPLSFHLSASVLGAPRGTIATDW